MRTIISAALLIASAACAPYNEADAMRAMYYSAASYCDKGTLDSWTCGEPCSVASNKGLTNFVRIENELLDTFAIVGYNKDNNEVVLAFRGTQGANFLNWLTNLVYYRVQYESEPNTQVHSGFYTAYSAVQSKIRNAIKPLLSNNPSAKLLITGHSLGGALATFAALDIRRNMRPSNQIIFITFGSPRIGNQAFTDLVFAAYPNGGYQRVTHYTDVVVQGPTRGMGFNHAGNEVWYYNSGNDMSYKICENVAGKPENPNCADSYIFTTGIDAHLTYLGHKISGMCLVKGVREIPYPNEIPAEFLA